MHISVLLQEVVDGLAPQPGDVILDATLGGGGHSEALCQNVHEATFICLDADEKAIERSKERLSTCSCTFHFYQTNFRNLDRALIEFGITSINRAVFDLGLSSYQLESSVEGASEHLGRGFSFRGSEPLTMTYASTVTPDMITAEQIVNEWAEENIATIIESYGEDRQARRIARAIVSARAVRPITTTAELRDIIERAVPRRGKIHPATKTFQALRMTVNDELPALQEGLTKAWSLLAPQGRIAVISFHSLEDRFVKNFFRDEAKKGTGILITKKPLVPTDDEVWENPRSRSAKLRIIEKI
ncbi:MAG: 16S rRNA (cytosine(1402)-N(4))-methyltransferase [Candidatus Taylorbacteria bacterium CG11_big_fil_rev_8_21_14_0_20_46_11]|uniref:Ribosomal RNA small subunit methyltransferase H n=1 Tax=Candidatus Taylorbacteria bacterium CG11_big_fil_rev_8_21_14_0_20_46_11 TaxID=1975025 RepID=A0A2H0KD10_9BACT|nr:MAG: 16S rRNA (cytosine(1402)-N(4))-methyltransferase [Candidatus Taylorbacteria bacterium CG11_big_fil_rev_8_21_14_0_20_46_11]